MVIKSNRLIDGWNGTSDFVHQFHLLFHKLTVISLLRHAYRLQMTCFLAEAANSFDVGTSFAEMSRISTPEAGAFLFLCFGSFGLCVINFLHGCRRLTVYSLFCYLGCFFHFLSHSDGVAKLQFIVLELEEYLKNCFVVDWTDEFSSQSNGSFMDWKSHVAASCCILLASSGIVLPGFCFMSDQNLKCFLTTNRFGSNCSAINVWISFIVSLCMLLTGCCWATKLLSIL